MSTAPLTSERAPSSQPSTVVRVIGFLLESELNMKKHIDKVTSTFFYQQGRHVVGQDLTAQPLHPFVLSRLDYSSRVCIAGLSIYEVDDCSVAESTNCYCWPHNELGTAWSRHARLSHLASALAPSSLYTAWSSICASWCIQSTPDKVYW